MGAGEAPREASTGSPPQPDVTTAPDRQQRRRGRWLFGALGVSLLLVGIGATVVSGAFEGRPGVRLASPDQPVNLSARVPADISANNSPTVVRNPTQPAELAVANRIDTPFFACALHVSSDGGASWTRTDLPAPEGEEAKCYSPDLAYSPDGTLYVSFVTLAGRGNVPNAVWLSTSEDGGETLSDPVRVQGPLAFQVRLAADPVRPGRVYLTWLQASGVGNLRFTTPGNPILMARSDDGGASWSEPVRVSSSVRQRVVTPVPVVGRDGSVYVLHLDLGEDKLDYEGAHEGFGGAPYPGRYSLVLARSRDAGATWEESVASDGIVPIDRFLIFLAPAPSLAVAPDGRVYAAFHSSELGDPDVWLWSLAPGASRWTGPTRVNDNPSSDGTAQYLPKLAVTPSGRLDVLYYDRRRDPNNLQNEVSLQSSFNEGRSFTPAVLLSSRPSDSRIGFGAKEDLPDLGSRLALISSDRAALGVWTDTRAGTPATQKQDIAAAAVTVSDPARLSATAEGALRYGGLGLGVLGLALLGLALERRWPRGRPPATTDGAEEAAS